jgi:WD40 repeat protein
VQQQRAEQANAELVLRNAELLMARDPTAVVDVLAGYRGADQVRHDMLLAEARGRGVAEAVFTPHSDTIWFLAGDASGAVFSFGEDRRIQVTRGGASTTLATDASTSPIYDHAVSAGLLAYARAPTGIGVLDLKTEGITKIEAGTATAIAIAPDGSRLAALDSRGRLTVWDLGPVGAAGSSRQRRWSVIFGPEPIDGVRLIFADSSKLLVRQKAGLRVMTLGAPGPRVTTAVLSFTSLHARDNDVIVGDGSGVITLLSQALTPIAKLSVCRARINSVRLAARAKRAAFACKDGVAGVVRYDEVRGEMLVVDTFQMHSAGLHAEPDVHGVRVIVRADSNTVYSYDSVSRLVARHEGHEGHVSSVAAPSSGFERILVGDVNGTIRVWKVPPRDGRVTLRT